MIVSLLNRSLFLHSSFGFEVASCITARFPHILNVSYQKTNAMMITSTESRNGSSDVDRKNKTKRFASLAREHSPECVTCFSSSISSETTEATETETETETNNFVGNGDCNEDCEGNGRTRESANAGNSNEKRTRLAPSVSVRFDKRVTVRFTRSHRDYSLIQFRNCWYLEDEVENIQSSNAEALQIEISRKGAPRRGVEGRSGFLGKLRGLENYDDAAHLQKRLLRARAADRVFDATDEGCDDVTIAKQYSSVTARSQTWANIVGLRDQRDAEFIYNEKPSAPLTQQRCR